MKWEAVSIGWQKKHQTGINAGVYYDILNDDFKIVIRQKNQSIWYKDEQHHASLLLEDAKKRADEKLEELLKENKEDV